MAAFKLGPGRSATEYLNISYTILGGPRSLLWLDRRVPQTHKGEAPHLGRWQEESGKLEPNSSLMQEFVFESVWAQWGPVGLPAPAGLSLVVCLMYRWCLSPEPSDAPSGPCADFQLICWLKLEGCKSVLVNVKHVSVFLWNLSWEGAEDSTW